MGKACVSPHKGGKNQLPQTHSPRCRGPQARPTAGRAGAAGDGWGVGHSSNTGQEEELNQAEPAWRRLDGAWGWSHGPPGVAMEMRKGQG